MGKAKMTNQRRFLSGLLAAALLAPAVALAGISWQFSGTGSVTSGGVTLTPSARAFTSGSSNDQLANATLYFYSGNGLGIRNADCCTADPGEDSSPEHTVDNQGRVDLVLLSFSEAINLQSVTIGWRDTDSDISVLAFKPNDASATSLPAINGLNHSQLMTAGFSLIGNYDGPGGSTGTDTTINTGTASSSKFWLVSAFDYRWAGTPSGIDKGDDYVKILALYGNKPSNGVPEPHALLLLGLAMIGLWATRRPRTRLATA
jgi:hypothetical protein